MIIKGLLGYAGSTIQYCGEQVFHPFLSKLSAPAPHGDRVNRRLMLKMDLATEVLVIGVTDPAFDQPLIGKAFHMFEHQQSSSQPGWCSIGATGTTETRLPLWLKGRPVNALRQSHQWVL